MGLLCNGKNNFLSYLLILELSLFMCKVRENIDKLMYSFVIKMLKWMYVYV